MIDEFEGLSTLGWITSILFGSILGLWAGDRIRHFLHEIAYPWIWKLVRRG